MKVLFFWWFFIYCLLMLIYIIYSAFRLRGFYLDKIKVNGTKIKFLPKVALRRLIENMGIFLAIYLVISLVLGVVYLVGSWVIKLF